MKIKELILKPELYDYLNSKKITTYFEVQEKVIPLLNKKKTVFVEAPTGTGKTLSFLLPLINNLDFEMEKLQVIIFSPTRELAKQIFNVLMEIKKFINFSALLASGGEEKEDQLNKMIRGTQVIVATPPRLEKLFSINSVSLTEIKYLIIDEADMCLEFGFFEYINQFAKNIPQKIT